MTPLPDDPLVWAATVALAAMLLAIAVIDARTLRIPDLLSLPLVALGLLAAWRLSILPLLDHMIGAAAGYAALAALGLAYRRLRGHDGLGLGDAKLLAAAGAWLGWAALPSVLLLASFTGLGHALARVAVGRGRGGGALAFGPHLAFALFAIWLLGPAGAGPVWR